ncbi:LysR family transcriptional regulator [Granulicella paludicola]|uniref:LysR family transcriptional regulator n=1 Tax=Granulicella paludicola TaxID=474951 RepID=UPI0021E05039|nr:LysR family transcriptional regulator [Granulicella paludicola]
MELKHLRSFLAVAERLSFIRAAEHLHLSQPALSSQIQNLEEELRVTLFFRTRRVVRLTPEGEVFVEEARATLARAEQAIVRVQKASRGEVGHLRIAFVSSAALEIVPRIVSTVRRKLPQVSLEIRNMRTSVQLQGLRDGTVDIGFVRLPLQHEDLNLRVINREPFAIVLPKSHPLAKRARVRLSDLRDELFVAYGRQWAPGFFDSIIRLCTDAGFSPNIVQETGEMFTAVALVAAGVGIAILPRAIVLAQRGDVVFKTLPLSLGVSEIAIATRKDRETPLLRSFLGIATDRSL